MDGQKNSFGIRFVFRNIILFGLSLLISGLFFGSCLLENIDLNNSGQEKKINDRPTSIYLSRVFTEGPSGENYYPGEEIEILFYLKNTGDSNAENIILKLSTDKIFTMKSNTNYWEVGSLEAGETRTFEARIKINDGIEADLKTTIDLAVSSDNTESLSRSTSMEILGVREYSCNLIPVIGLHSITDKVELPIELSITNFDILCKTLKEYGYQTITLNDLLKHIDKGRALPERAVILTFDDGYQDNYTTAFPILKKYGYTMTIFLPTGCIADDEEGRMDNSSFTSHSVFRPLLTWPEIREMYAYGCEFQSHTVNHIELGLSTDQEVLDELIKSKLDIEKHLGETVSFIAWPFGDYPENKWPLIEEAGYRGALRNWGGVEDTRSIDLNNIGRVEFYDFIPPDSYAGYLGLLDISMDI